MIFGILSLCFAACENDMSKVKQIELKQKEEIEITKGAEIIYSDSARVKARLTTPILYNHKTAKNPFYEMPKGIVVIFYDDNLKQTSKVTSEYAIRKENEKIIELKKNVVATNAEGKTFKSEELIWDENLKRFYSNRVVTITTDKATISGTSFWATEDFSYYEIKQGAGPIQFNQ
ncbi:MAG: LPS export ABC transporter periplasmic protein LptC [Bacteroidetes bacterium]|nr:LPS export ABC transporter periplasmic protein LptC [Bacteroidota bacterium]MBU1761972.1 LPS export ABC transporter periplasmic protein LptC [Bacteroidota bacterium]